ncbi:MAG: hypothetical protein KAS05_00185 [Candidatus Omnitrophica bacterium]|nr:hypothetical protein [Candidatus Omnitrophota bacterium]
MVNFDDFSKLEFKTGKILEVSPHPDAEKLYLLKVDIGGKVIQIVAGIKPFYTPEQLENKLIVVLANLESKNIRGALSEGMILAAQGKDDVSLVVLDKEMDAGNIIK